MNIIDNNEIIEKYLRKKIHFNENNVKKRIKINDKKLKERIVFKDIIKYVDDFLKKDVYHRIITLPGLRGVGKTTLLFQVYNYLLEQGISKERILYLNTEELMEFPDTNLLSTIKIFIEDIHDSYPTIKEKLFILVDESQYDPKWVKAAKIIYDEYVDVFMIFTGSSAIDIETTTDAARRIKRIAIYPLNFKEYLYLKYDVKLQDISPNLNKILQEGDLNSIKEIENNITFNKFPQLNKNPKKIWEEYVKYGGFGYSLIEDEDEIVDITIQLTKKIIEKDLRSIKDFTLETQQNALKLIKILAMQKPGDISANKLGDILNISTSQVKVILDLLEKADLIHHLEAYGSVTKKNRRSWKYYFISPTIKYAINKYYGFTQENEKQIMGLLTEDLVASILYHKRLEYDNFDINYESGKGGVDYILTLLNGKKIPIEVGYGKKTLKQVYKSIDRNNTTHGILISNKTTSIKEKDNIICIPLIFFSIY